jgi:uncharacterized protein (UPF0332 family)
MKDLTARALEKARTSLVEADAMLKIALAAQAARMAYIAQFQAARALIFERTGRMPKTHNGVKTLFSDLARSESVLPRGLSRNMAAAYKFKETVDYALDNDSGVSKEDATDALEAAEKFVEAIERVLADPRSQTPQP